MVRGERATLDTWPGLSQPKGASAFLCVCLTMARRSRLVAVSSFSLCNLPPSLVSCLPSAKWDQGSTAAFLPVLSTEIVPAWLHPLHTTRAQAAGVWRLAQEMTLVV